MVSQDYLEEMSFSNVHMICHYRGRCTPGCSGCKTYGETWVDVFEQPLAANNLLGHAELRRKTFLPIALDESIWTPSDLLQAIRLEACDVVVIKFTKMGGFLGAKQCGELAHYANLQLLGGGLTESTLALTANAHLFNYLGIDTPVDLNGPLFLTDDPVADGPQINEGQVTLPAGYGLGCTVDMGKVHTFLQKDIC